MASLIDLLQAGRLPMGDVGAPQGDALTKLLAMLRPSPDGKPLPGVAVSQPASFGSLAPLPATDVASRETAGAPYSAPPAAPVDRMDFGAGYRNAGPSMETGSVAPPTSRRAQAGPDTLGQIGAFLSGLSGNGGISNLMDYNREHEARNQTVDMLTSKGLSEAEARGLINNPTALQSVIVGLYGSKQTDDQREYAMAKQQGFDGSFMDYMTAVKKAGATQNIVNTDMRAESAEAKARGEGLGKRLNSIADDGVEAQKDLVALSRISQLSGNVDPGTKTALLDEIRNLTGVALDPNTDNVQALKAAISYLAPRMRVPGSGASSDRDVSMFLRALPSLMGTPDGNKLVMETLGGMSQARMARADIAAQWQRGEIDAKQADAAMSALPDPFAAFKAATPGQTAAPAADLPVATPEQAAKLPPGTRFKGTDGKVRTR